MDDVLEWLWLLDKSHVALKLKSRDFPTCTILQSVTIEMQDDGPGTPTPLSQFRVFLLSRDPFGRGFLVLLQQ